MIYAQAALAALPPAAQFFWEVKSRHADVVLFFRSSAAAYDLFDVRARSPACRGFFLSLTTKNSSRRGTLYPLFILRFEMRELRSPPQCRPDGR